METATAVELEDLAQRIPRLADVEGQRDGRTAGKQAIYTTASPVEQSGSTEQASQTGAPSVSSTAPPALTRQQRWRARLMYGTLLWSMFLTGWNDSTNGPLLPRIQLVYHISFVVVSLIFVSNFLGSALAAVLNVWLTDRFGFGKVIVIGAISQIVGYALAASAPPFPVFVLAYLFNGFGISLQLSASNTFVAGFKKNVSTKIAFLYASYGAGALSSPFIATQFSQLTHWSFHFLVSLGFATINVSLMLVAFRLRTQEACLTEIGLPPSPDDSDTNRNGSKYKQIMRLPHVHLMALFVLIYVGTEVTLGGWIVTYVIDLRGGGPSSGYISSGFFGGLMVGRVLLLGVNKLVGEGRAMYIYGVLAIGLEVVVWFVPSLVGGAVAVAGVGMLLGPMFPIVMNHARNVLPPWLLSGSIGWIAGFGNAGSAFLPFLTGALASKAGIKVLQPVVVSMMCAMVGIWVLVPKAPRRLE